MSKITDQVLQHLKQDLKTNMVVGYIPECHGIHIQIVHQAAPAIFMGKHNKKTSGNTGRFFIPAILPGPGCGIESPRKYEQM